MNSVVVVEDSREKGYNLTAGLLMDWPVEERSVEAFLAVAVEHRKMKDCNLMEAPLEDWPVQKRSWEIGLVVVVHLRRKGCSLKVVQLVLVD